ncbi:MAG: hypothetical protein IIA85_00020 [Nanoarchaeota archaeon]|nr:hypothetical protein [Nanoarchaeota archaeon]
MSDESIQINLSQVKKLFDFTKKSLKDKRVQWVITLIVLFGILFISSSIRTSNLDLLKDSTTEEYIPLALDPYYFLRVSETYVANDGILPEIDPLRSPSINVAWHPEIMPKVVYLMYKGVGIFNSKVTIQYMMVISPVVFFVIGLFIFFLMSYVLSKRKSIALTATTILAFAPSYLYRTMAGFSDHEAIGMIAIFSFFLIYVLSLKYFEKNWKYVIIGGLTSGFMVAFVLATWGGAVTFILTVFPLAFLMYWGAIKKDELKAISFYSLLILSSIISPLFFGFSWTNMLNRFSGSYGLLVPFVLGYILIDFGLSKLIKLGKYKDLKLKERKAFYTVGITGVLGIVGLKVLGKSVLGVFRDIWFKLINPFGNLGGGRLGSTVAENAQPYLVDWISQSGKVVFWLFVIGVLFIGLDFIRKMENKRYKLLFISSWIVVVSGILFSRISSTSPFNGASFISQAFYLLSLVFFGISLLGILNKGKFKVDARIIVILSILFFTLINGRSATRIFFLIAPFVSFAAAYSVERLFYYTKNSKDDLCRLILGISFIIAIILLGFSIYGSYETIKNQAQNAGPINSEWLTAMEWVRENTNEGDVFVHWWDYGYWIQSLGERPTVTDGGHSGGSQADHYIGRYVLTTPNPDSALSYMKTWNVSYLLIDPTDLGKYPAYSSIGGGSENSQDRYASISVMLLDPKQTVETTNGTTLVYNSGMVLFEDIIYRDNGSEIFLPSGNSFLAGVVVNSMLEKGKITLTQPIGIYVFNNKQVRIPIRYLYAEGKLVDYGNGLDVVIDIIPSLDGQSINPMGAAIYLSQKVSKSLFAQLYLLNDAFGNYPTLRIAHEESNNVIKAVRSSGYSGGEFIYYQGFRGPIKIWEVDYPFETEVIEEFKDDLGNVYARFDNRFY